MFILNNNLNQNKKLALLECFDNNTLLHIIELLNGGIMPMECIGYFIDSINNKCESGYDGFRTWVYGYIDNAYTYNEILEVLSQLQVFVS